MAKTNKTTDQPKSAEEAQASLDELTARVAELETEVATKEAAAKDLDERIAAKSTEVAELENAFTEKRASLEALGDSIEASDVENDRLADEIKAKTEELSGLNEKLTAAGKPPVAPEPRTVQGNLVLKKNSIFLNGKTIMKENFSEQDFADLVEAYDGDEDKAIQAHMVEVK